MVNPLLSPLKIPIKFVNSSGFVPEPASAVIFNSNDLLPVPAASLSIGSRKGSFCVPLTFALACCLAPSIKALLEALSPFVNLKASCITLRLSAFALLSFALSSRFLSVASLI